MRSGQSESAGVVAGNSGFGCEASGVGSVADAAGLDIGEYGAKPAQVEAALLGHVVDQVAAAGGQHRFPLAAQLAEFRDTGILPVDLDVQSLGDQAEVGEMQEEHRAVEGRPEIACRRKLRMQEFAKAVASARGDAVDRAHAAPSHALVRDGGEQAGFGKLAHGVVERADIDIGKALDHGLGQTPLDLVGVKVAAVKHAQNI